MKKWFTNYLIRFICYSICLSVLYGIFTYLPSKNELAYNGNSLVNKSAQSIRQDTEENNSEKSAESSNEYSSNNTQATINRKILEKKFPNHYLARAITNGYIVRWNPDTFPLKVYIQHKTDLPEYFYTEVKKAFLDWQTKTDRFINFTFVDSPRNADIRCYFPKNDAEADDFSKKFGGITHSEIKNSTLQYMTITFSTKYKGIDKYYTSEIVHSVALHEIGHALGILGHSVNPYDIMYPRSSTSREQISSGDINTLKLIYSIVPDVSNKNFTKEDKNKFLTIADIFGDDDERINLELANTIEDREITKDDPNKIMHIGSLYYKKGDYAKAIENYKLASEKIFNDNQLSAKVHYNIALSYLKLNSYKEAIEHVKLSQKLFPSDNTLELTGRIYYKSGDNNAAKRILVGLLNKDPKIYNAYITLAHIYKDENDVKNWNILYEMGKEYFPDNPPLRRH